MATDATGVAEVKAHPGTDRPLGDGQTGRYVAVVDDDRSVGIALCRLLRAAGIEAKAFESAAGPHHPRPKLVEAIVHGVPMSRLAQRPGWQLRGICHPVSCSGMGPDTGSIQCPARER